MSGLRIGLTGGLAAGKSTVGELLREAGMLVVDADRLVADLYRPGQAGAAAARRLFGDGVIDQDGGVDHRGLAAIIFRDPEARDRLERAIHPLVGTRFLEIVADHEGDAVLEATLLVEAGIADDFDAVITVEAPEPIRLARAVARGMDGRTARERLAAQGDGERRRAGASHLLDSSGSLRELELRLGELVASIRQAQRSTR